MIDDGQVVMMSETGSNGNAFCNCLIKMQFGKRNFGHAIWSRNLKMHFESMTLQQCVCEYWRPYGFQLTVP